MAAPAVAECQAVAIGSLTPTQLATRESWAAASGVCDQQQLIGAEATKSDLPMLVRLIQIGRAHV